MSRMKHKQQGFVSIIVAAILMILLSLITIGFFQLMQREQRQSLDRQLSTQAFYAAETAVNDVYNNLDAIPEEKNDCDVTADPMWNNGAIDAAEDTVAYSCLLYDKTPEDLLFTDKVNTGGSVVFPIQSKNNAPIGSVTFSWDGPVDAVVAEGRFAYHSSTCGATPVALPAATSFDANHVPLIRMDLISAPLSGFDRAHLMGNTASVYLFSKGGCGSSSASFNNLIGSLNGQVIEVNCSDTDACTFTIDGLAASNRYYARVKSIYNNVHSFGVTAATSNGTPFEFYNAQTQVDATGRANDVVRRIDVRISNNPDFIWPEAAAQASEGICKTLKYAATDIVENTDPYNNAASPDGCD